ncbi:MAG: hypothetical protein P8Y99_10290, partial [Calditrichaceae bacterium]
MKIFLLLFLVFCICNFLSAQNIPVGTTMADFFLPGSQPHQSGDLSSPASCSCHELNEISFGWEGSMM